LAALPIFQRLRNPTVEKIEIEILFPARKTPGHDLRFGIVNRAPYEAVAPILQRNDISIVRRTEDFQDLTAEDPVVSVKDSRARFNDKATHRRSLTGRAICGASESRTETGQSRNVVGHCQFVNRPHPRPSNATEIEDEDDDEIER
jgi:hypothetical protein